jgi:hypothetical protein
VVGVPRAGTADKGASLLTAARKGVSIEALKWINYCKEEAATSAATETSAARL